MQAVPVRRPHPVAPVWSHPVPLAGGPCLPLAVVLDGDRWHLPEGAYTVVTSSLRMRRGLLTTRMVRSVANRSSGKSLGRSTVLCSSKI